MTPAHIGKYEILGEIGRGTMGTVYKAMDPVLKRAVAIKTMVATPGRNDESKQRFQREAQAAALLSHPNIVTVHDLGEEQGLIYMAMEYLEGRDLRDLIAAGAPKALDETLAIMEQVAAGLAFAHSKGVVHRDLKPANIHIQPNGQVKIVDFGLARLGGSDMTQTGVVLGTPNYMSPEQALGDKVDARSDIFSVGGVFYELLSGRKPFDAETTPGVLYQVVHKEPASLRKWAPQAPGVLLEVVDRCLAKDKTVRFQNGRQLRAALGLCRQALDSGRAASTTLAEESQRASEETRKDGSGSQLSPAASRAPWADGSAVRAPAPEPRPERRSDPRQPIPTLSGRAPTDPAGRRAPTRPPRGSRTVPLALGGLALLFVAGAGVAYWQKSRAAEPPAGPATRPGGTPGSGTDVGALTEALVDSQLELARNDLEDKNWADAISRAERTLKLQPGNAQARVLLEQARARLRELDTAAGDARRALESGSVEDASRALDRVLDLDPQHPVVGELTARLNSVYRSRAEEGLRLAQRSRAEAEAANAGSGEGFGAAASRLGEGEALFRKGEFANATQRYLEARDGFERARRSKLAAARATPSPSAAPSTAPAEAQTAATGERPGTSPSPASTPESVAHEPARHFVTGKSTVAGARAGGGVSGFDNSDVRTQKVPDLVGRLEFQAEPDPPRPGDPVRVQVFLVNDGRKVVRVRAVSAGVSADGQRTNPQVTLLEREVASQARVLVAETRVAWPGSPVSSWSLETTLTSDRGETCSARLTWQ